jgi:hypothetical protein
MQTFWINKDNCKVKKTPKGRGKENKKGKTKTKSSNHYNCFQPSHKWAKGEVKIAKLRIALKKDMYMYFLHKLSREHCSF